MAEMTAAEAVEWGKTLDFPAVWAALMEGKARTDKLEEKVDKMNEELSRNINELRESVHELRGSVHELWETVKVVSKNVGGLNGSMGELIESLFAPNLGKKFDAWHYNLNRSFPRVRIYDDTGRLRGDIDILLSNTTICMAVEIKRWLDSTEKVEEHIKRMQLIRKYPPAETKEKSLIGAIAAAVVYPEVREYAEENGFFVLELTGEDIRLLDPPKDFQPKEW